MPSNEGPEYHVDHLPEVVEQIRALAKKAVALGIDREFFQTLKTIVGNLGTRPLDWSDPERRTRKEGGYICHGLLSPLLVNYVVFDPERVVFISKIKPLPGSPLD